MVLYRITRRVYADDLSGTGARLYGGRWNSKGKAVVYTASSQSLALLEVLVHLTPLLIPKDYYAVEIEVPDESILSINSEYLPEDWNDLLPPATIKKIGDTFLAENKYLLLKVPSAIVPDEFNYLINVSHPLMEEVRVVKKKPFSFDERLVNRH